jgi:arabinan endo-1,5-alpha-L-arabinosidase
MARLSQRSRFSKLATLLLSAALGAPLSILGSSPWANAATSGANGSHDPSRMIESDGKFYVYSTGGGSKSSPDGLVWTNGPGIFSGAGIPSTTTSVVSSNEGVWAPDVIYLNGQYYLYYSIANAQNACAVGLITSPTLDPSSSKYHWTDRGLVVSNTGSATYCTIDPAPVLDAAGNLWLAWGSGYSHPTTANTIFVTRLDNTTGLASSADSAKPGHALEQGHIEASYIHYHGGYYYLFWNSGGCCDGVSSSYLIHVARSPSITGPYTGTKNFYGSTGNVHGPGHIGIYEQCGVSRFTYHYYPDNSSVLGENELSWGNDGWPVVGAESTAPLKACGNSSGGAAGAGGSTSGGAGAGVGQGGVAGNVVDAGGSSNGGAATSGGAGETNVSAGAPGAGGSSGGPASGGNAGSVSSVGAPGRPLPAAGSSADDGAASNSGCSCRAGAGMGTPNSAGTGLAALGALLARWRRRRDAQPDQKSGLGKPGRSAR